MNFLTITLISIIVGLFATYIAYQDTHSGAFSCGIGLSIYAICVYVIMTVSCIICDSHADTLDYTVEKTYFLDENDSLQIDEADEKYTIIKDGLGEAYEYDLLERKGLSDYSEDVNEEVSMIVEVLELDDSEWYKLGYLETKIKVIIYKD